MVKIMENPIKMDDLGVPPFKETPICFRWLQPPTRRNIASEDWWRAPSKKSRAYEPWRKTLLLSIILGLIEIFEWFIIVPIYQSSRLESPTNPKQPGALFSLLIWSPRSNPTQPRFDHPEATAEFRRWAKETGRSSAWAFWKVRFRDQRYNISRRLWRDKHIVYIYICIYLQLKDLFPLNKNNRTNLLIGNNKNNKKKMEQGYFLCEWCDLWRAIFWLTGSYFLWSWKTLEDF